MPIATITAMFVMFAGSFAGNTGAVALNSTSTTEHSATASSIVLTSNTLTLDDLSADLNQKDMERQIRSYYKDTPVLAEIAFCESSFRQLDRNGNVVRGRVDSDDVGIMQINETYQGARAAKLGYDLETIEGNIGYAEYLYQHEGTAPWSASEPCWGKSIGA